MSVKEHMTSMANSIRSISGLTSKMNLSTIASNVSKCKEQIDIEGQLMYNLLLKLLGKLGITSIDADIETTGTSSDLMMGKEMIDDSGNKVVGSAIMVNDEENLVKLLERTISGVYSNDTIESLPTYAFRYCSSLTSVDFPACTRIDGNAFAYCTSLTSVSFPVCATIGAYGAFSGCSSLTSVDFPVCTTIGNSAFSNCTSLTSVSFPACTRIGSYAFSNCTSLTSVSFPVCTNIGSSTFYRCTSLTSLTLGASTVCTLSNINAFNYTPMSNSTYTGTYGSIYVPASLVDAYKSATNWATYSSRIGSII